MQQHAHHLAVPGFATDVESNRNGWPERALRVGKFSGPKNAWKRIEIGSGDYRSWSPWVAKAVVVSARRRGCQVLLLRNKRSNARVRFIDLENVCMQMASVTAGKRHSPSDENDSTQRKLAKNSAFPI